MSKVTEEKILVFAPFYSDAETSRSRVLCHILHKQEYKLDLLTTRFCHASKKLVKHQESLYNIIYLESLPYKSNRSLKRFVSHLLFIGSSLKFIKENGKDYSIIYFTVPFAWSAYLSKKYLLTNQKIIVDILDIWPDTLPFPRMLRNLLFPVFDLWRLGFKKALFKADKVISHSNDHLNEVKKYSDELQTFKILLGTEQRFIPFNGNPSKFSVAYAGNLGHLYDFETLLEVLGKWPEDVELHVIGDGDRKEWLELECKRLGIQSQFYGTVFEPEKLVEVFAKCSVGFNGFKETSASVSYKSTTYFSYGLPIVNSMKGELANAVDDYKLGKNYKTGDVDSLQEVMEDVQVNFMNYHKSVCNYFSRELSLEAVGAKWQEVFMS